MEGKSGVAEVMEQAFLAGLGAAAWTRDRIEDGVNELVERGRMTRDEAYSLVDRMVERGRYEREEMSRMVREEVRRALEVDGVATTSDVRAEIHQAFEAARLVSRDEAEELERRVARLEGGTGAVEPSPEGGGTDPSRW